jgi:AraC-like DNA-binding protein
MAYNGWEREQEVAMQFDDSHPLAEPRVFAKDAIAPRPYAARRGTANAAILVGMATELGMSTHECLRGTGIARAALDDPDAEISAEEELQLVRNIVAGLEPDPALGLRAARDVHTTAYGIFGLGLLSSATVRDALAFALRYFDLSYTVASFSVRTQADRFVATFEYPPVTPSVERFLLGRDAMVYTSFFRESLGMAVRPLRVTCRVDAPDAVTPYETSLGVRPSFGADTNSVAYDHRLLDRRLPLANTHTLALCERLCRDLAARRRSADTVARRVRRALDVSLARATEPLPSPAEVAAALHVSGRTLRRELSAEGTSFRQIADQVLAEFAQTLLARGATIDDVARRLGYSETSSFSRAFKRWTGSSPSAYGACSTVAA